MTNSFSSWSSITESNIARGKEVMIDSVTGKRHKVTFAVQSSTKFIMKIINDLDIINSGRITPQGEKALIDYLNSESTFIKTVGQLSPQFFTNSFIVYSVIKDGEILGRLKQKIQFETVARKDSQGNQIYPNIPNNIRFIDSDSFKSQSQQAIQIIDDLNKEANKTNLPDPAVEPSSDKTTNTTQTSENKGKKFLYTMRTNNKLYLMEFTDSGEIVAKTRDGSDPNGTISYDTVGKLVLWHTTLDDANSKDSKIGKTVSSALFYDMTIENAYDKEFFIKIFTDKAFRDKTIEEYEKEYGKTELTSENLRNMLYYKDGVHIFGENKTSSASTSTENGLSQEDIDKMSKAFSDIRGQINSTETTKK